MGFNCGIVGLPNVGKSTIFNAITAAGAESANYPFCTIEPNTGVVDIPDKRLKKLSDIVNPERVLPAQMEFVDIAGLVKGASKSLACPFTAWIDIVKNGLLTLTAVYSSLAGYASHGMQNFAGH